MIPVKPRAHRKLDWVKDIETPIGSALRAYARGELLGIEALRLIDEIMGRGLGRGYALPSEPLDWEHTEQPGVDAEQAYDRRQAAGWPFHEPKGE